MCRVRDGFVEKVVFLRERGVIRKGKVFFGSLIFLIEGRVKEEVVGNRGFGKMKVI